MRTEDIKFAPETIYRAIQNLQEHKGRSEVVEPIADDCAVQLRI